MTMGGRYLRRIELETAEQGLEPGTHELSISIPPDVILSTWLPYDKRFRDGPRFRIEGPPGTKLRQIACGSHVLLDTATSCMDVNDGFTMQWVAGLLHGHRLAGGSTLVFKVELQQQGAVAAQLGALTAVQEA